MSHAKRIGVLGPNRCSEEEAELGRQVGSEVARRGGVLVCGGLGGMMTASAEGARTAGGFTVGILPGDTDDEANPFIDLPLPTGMGPMRNMLVVRTCDAVIAIRGAYGTLSEIAFALRLGVPVVGLRTWALLRDGVEDPGIHTADTPEEAVAVAFRLAGEP